MDAITVLIVDDHAIARLGLRTMLDGDPRVRVVGEAADGQQALERTLELSPAVVLMDIKMPGMDGVAATRQLKERFPAVAVLMLTNYDDEALVVEAVRAGAGGYLLKDASHELLLYSIGAVASGGILVEATLLRKAIGTRDMRPAPTERRPALAGIQFSERDLIVLRRMAEGQTNKEIGDALGLAEVTVKKYVQAIIARLHASDRTHATITALRQGLIN